MVTHALMQARPSRWGPGKVHVVDESSELNALFQPMLVCGKRATAPTHRGSLEDATCGACLRSMERQVRELRFGDG